MRIPITVRCFARAPWPPLFAVSALGLALSALTIDEMAGFSDRAMLHHTHNPPGAATFLGDWALMLCAMMPPLLAAPLMHVSVSSLARRRIRAMALLLAGYGAVWMAAAPLLFMIATVLRSAAADAALLLALSVAGLWAVSPWQQLALNRCHRLRRIGLFGLAADRDCLAFGLRHGGWCVGACWAWMLVPLTVDRWHLPVMLAAGAAMFAQKLSRPREPRWRVAMPWAAGAVGTSAAGAR